MSVDDNTNTSNTSNESEVDQPINPPINPPIETVVETAPQPAKNKTEKFSLTIDTLPKFLTMSVGRDNSLIMFKFIKENGSQEQKSLVAILESYVDKMKLNQQLDKQTGASYQKELYLQIINVLNNSPSTQFQILWSIILRFAFLHSESSFSEIALRRYFPTSWVNESESALFSYLISLITKTADPKTVKSALKEIDLSKIILLLPVEAKTRLAAYYS